MRIANGTFSPAKCGGLSMRLGRRGGISYGAPSGYHDDCVMALALANHRRWESESAGRMLTVGTSALRWIVMGRRRERSLVG